jgi:flagellar biosynthesis protein FlhF
VKEDRLVDDTAPYTPPPSIVDAVEPRGTPTGEAPVAAGGPDPIVLEPRRTRPAASIPPPPPSPPPSGPPERAGQFVVVGPVLDESGPGRTGMAVVTLGEDDERTSASIRRGRHWRRGGSADRLFRRYVHHGVDDIVAAELVQGAHVAGAREEAALDQIVRRLGASRLASTDAPWVPEPRGGRRVVALVGPTGVGKTTTLAKLAAKAILTSRARVALITIDTYRICASDQLARYGQIMRAPTFVARDAAQLRSALDGTRDCDIVFVDSAGRSVQSELEAQIQMLRSATELRMYLTLSLASGDRELAFNCRRYAFLEPERVILTKFDEAIAPGAALAPLIRLGRPVTCVTNGQEVPEHIRAVDSVELMDVLLGPAVEASSGAEPKQSAGRA